MKRIKDLIDQVSLPLSVPKDKTEEIHSSYFPVARDIESASSFRSNPMLDREVLESIDSTYYDSNADTNIFELEKLPSNPTEQLVNEMKGKLRTQLNSVSKKLSDVILENQPSYQKELQQVRELQKTLKVALNTCSNGKKFLLSATTTSNLRLLVNVQRKRNLSSLHLVLETIKTLEHTDVRLRELLEDEDYPEAIQLCLECQKAAITYKQYNCIKDLYSKLQDTIELIEEQIDVALSKICNRFDKKVYEKLQNGYKLLGKPQTAVDQLLMHFTSCIHNTAFQIVLGHVKLCSSELQTNLHKKQFSDLCSNIEMSIYIPCLLALCKSLWNIMNCYYKVSLWHTEEFEHLKSDDMRQVEFDYRYIQQKLKHGRHRVWLDVQSRVRTFLLGTDLSGFKYDEFIRVLDIVKKFVSLGKAFCQNISTSSIEESQETEMKNSNSLHQNLQDPVYQQSLHYFHAYHQKCMEELHMFLDNEAWECIPMSANFSLQQLPEFKFLLEANYNDIIKTPFSGNNASQPHNSPYFHSSDDEKYHPFLEFESDEKDNQATFYTPEIPFENESDDEELLQDFVDEETEDGPRAISSKQTKKNSHPQGPILTNTALNVLRICGKYLKMCDVLKPIAMDVIICMSNLFDYYLFSVFKFFVAENGNRPPCSEKLSAALKRIEGDIIRHEFESMDESRNGVNQQVCENARVPVPSLSPIINLNHKANLFGFAYRITATESLMNLAKQFENLKLNLEKLIPTDKQAFLHQFYSQTVSTCNEVSSLVYFEIAVKSIDYELVLNRMGQVKWDIRDIMSQHSHYVDELIHQFQLLRVGFSPAAQGLTVPKEITLVIWKHCILLANRTLVEGYSNVKRCSNEGRALMQLDFQQFLLKIDQLTKVRPIPGRELVEGYIKAFYLAEEDLELWMKDHKEYSQKQLSALVNCSAASSVGNTNRKNKQRLLSLIEDITGRR